MAIKLITSLLRPRNESVRPRRLLVDLSVIARTDAGTGIQRVVRALLSELTVQLPRDMELVVVAASKYRGYRKIANPVTGGGRGGFLLPRRGDIFLGLDLAAHLLPRHERQVRWWKRRGVMIIVLVYDLLPIHHPDWFTSRTGTAFRRWLDLIGRLADSALCISNTVRADLEAYLLARSGRCPRTSVIRLGADIASTRPSRGRSPEEQRSMDQLDGRPFILLVGTVEPRKGHEAAVAAFDAIWRREANNGPLLVLVGRPGWNTESLQARLRSHPELGDRLFWFDDASDETLGDLYESAAGVLIASFGEGYGLPIIEAGRYGRRILARDLPIFREIGGEKLTYFMNDAPDALANAIVEWFQSPNAPTFDTAMLPCWSEAAADVLREIDLVTSALKG